MAFYFVPANLEADESHRSVENSQATGGVRRVSSCLLANISILHGDKQKDSIINDSELSCD